MNKSRLELVTESALFSSRWLLAPFYIGMAVSLVTLLGVFIISFGFEFAELFHKPIAKLPEAGILMSLSMIDLSLTANLVIIVILSGYENFVSRIDVASDSDRPSWMGKVDFSGLKIKLIASIVAISAIDLLRGYLEIGDHAPDQGKLLWQVIILLAFVVSGVLLALMDLIVARTERH